MDQKEKNRRADIVSWIAIIIGVGVGILLRKARFGFIFGLILGIVIVYLWSRQKQRLNK
jgi:divalent metal cation (Fe/Co/Zn/Cd) transporter